MIENGKQKMKNKFQFKEYIKESPVGMVGRTGQKDAQAHISDELMKEFQTIVKKLGGKAVVKELLNTKFPLDKSQSTLPKDIDTDGGVPQNTISEATILSKDYGKIIQGISDLSSKSVNLADSAIKLKDEKAQKLFQNVKKELDQCIKNIMKIYDTMYK